MKAPASALEVGVSAADPSRHPGLDQRLEHPPETLHLDKERRRPRITRTTIKTNLWRRTPAGRGHEPSRTRARPRTAWCWPSSINAATGGASAPSAKATRNCWPVSPSGTAWTSPDCGGCVILPVLLDGQAVPQSEVCAADGVEPLPAGGALHLTGFRVRGKHTDLPVERTSVGQPTVGLADDAARPSGGARVRHAGVAPPSVVASRDIVC